MAARTLRVLTRTPYDFSKLQAAQSQTIIVARGIDVRDVREATMIVRAHAGTSVSGIGGLAINAYADGFTDQDPAASSGNLPAFLAVIGGSADIKGATSGSLTLGRLDTSAGGFGPMIAIGITATQAVSPVTAVLWLSIGLSLKD